MKMDEDYSLYLDCTRFFAAVFVVVAHLIQGSIFNSAVAHYIPDLGREAVMIFFVLSGYVIAYTCDVKKPSLSEYAIARASRIYSVAFPVLIMSFLAVYLSSNVSGTDYYQINKFFIYIPFHSLFLGEIWNMAERPHWLVPYWSLSYEVWYYIFFASIYFFSGLKRLFIGAVIFLILGHKLWLLLPVWLSGVLLYKYQSKISMSELTARAGWVLSIVLLCIYKHLDLDVQLRALGNQLWPIDSLVLSSADRYLSDYVVTLMVIMNFTCARHAKFNVLTQFSRFVRNVSAYTFTLYLVHALVLSIWLNHYSHDNNSFLDIALLVLAILSSTYMIGQLTERRKYMFTNMFIYIYKISFGRWRIDVKNPYS